VLSQEMVGLIELWVAVGALAALWMGLNRKPEGDEHSKRDHPK
jgi:hypothetical protein